MTSPPAPNGGRPAKRLPRFAGVGLIVTALVAAVIGPFVLARFREALSDPRHRDTLDPERLTWLFAYLIERPSVFVLCCLPAVLCGVMVLAGARPRGVWAVLGLLAALAAFALLLGCVIAVLAPLYQYQEL